MNTALDSGPYMIRVTMWYEDWQDPLNFEFCGQFVWGTEFRNGPARLFDHPREALECITADGVQEDISGFMYRYQIIPTSAVPPF